MNGRMGYPDVFQDQVALGIVPGFTGFRKFGMNDSVAGTSTLQEVWPIGTPRTLPAAAAVCAVSSDDVNDDGSPASTGALTLTIEGLDANYLEISETITLNGTTTVNTTKSFLRINRAYVATSGSSKFNEGNITITIGGATQAYVEAEEGQTHQCMYTVPADKYLLVKQYRWTLGRMAGSTDCQVGGLIMLFGSNTWRYISDIYGYGPENYVNDNSATLIPPKTEVRMITVSSGTTQISGIFAGYLIESNLLTGMK